MKISLTALLKSAFVGKKIAKQHGVDECFWGRTIIDIIPCSYYSGDKDGYYISTDCIYRSGFNIGADYELEAE